MALGELEGRVDDLVIDGDRIAWRFTLRGVHRGTLLGRAATHRRIELRGVNFQRLAAAWSRLTTRCSMRSARSSRCSALEAAAELLALVVLFELDHVVCGLLDLVLGRGDVMP